MQLLVVAQATGHHGWSALEAWVHGARQCGHHVRLVQPKGQWGQSSLDDDGGFVSALEAAPNAPVLLCGVDWHSQPLHGDAAIREALRRHPGPRIGLFQEHLSASWIRQDDRQSRLFDTAAMQASECLTHIVCHHEADLDHLRHLGVKASMLFLPFAADLQAFQRRRSWADRSRTAFFRGKLLTDHKSQPYAQREKLMRALQALPEACVAEWTAEVGTDRRRMVQSYVEDLNAHALQLNLPSLSSSLTCRPFEILACGGTLLQPIAPGEISREVIPERLYVPFDADDAEGLLRTIRACQAAPKDMAERAEAGYQHVRRWHGARLRVEQLLSWATGGIRDADVYRQLQGRADMPASVAVAPAVQPTRTTGLRVLVDLVFYQYANSGIAQVWNQILAEWLGTGLQHYVVLARRQGAPHAPPHAVLAAYEQVQLPPYGSPEDAALVQRACDSLDASIFISTYYSRPLRTPSMMMVHDCIPERVNAQVKQDAHWEDKRRAIGAASAFFCVSQTTARDLQQFYPQETRDKPVYVGRNGFGSHLRAVDNHEVLRFKTKLGLQGDYLLFVGERCGYLGYKNTEVLARALSVLARWRPRWSRRFTLLFIGGAELGHALTIEPEIDRHLAAWRVMRHTARPEEMAAAYSGAALLLYPSVAEGFGLPPGEALHCGTPALLWEADIHREVYGNSLPRLQPASDWDLAKQIDAHLRALPALRDAVPDALQRLLRQGQAQGGASQGGTLLECLILHGQRTAKLTDPATEPVLFDAYPPDRPTWLERLIWGHPNQIKGDLDFGKERLDSAALVSIYNAAPFIEGCLEDLLEQTAYADGRMEILLLDSASPGEEFSRIRDIIRKHPRLLYSRSTQRESLYRSWNRGARYSRAKALSSANVDDRHRIDFFARLSSLLATGKEIQLVYPAQYIGTHANEPFSKHWPNRSWGWPPFSLEQLRIGNHVGSQPMWLRSLHKRLGGFDERFRIAGDYDFWLRIAQQVGPLQLDPVHTGLYFFNGSGVEHGDPLQSNREMGEICARHGIPHNYTVSDADRSRADAAIQRPRQLRDLQYSGQPLLGDLNVLLMRSGGGCSDLLQDVCRVQSQTLASRYRLCIWLVDTEPAAVLSKVANDTLRSLGPTVQHLALKAAALGRLPKATCFWLAVAPDRPDLLSSALERLRTTDSASLLADPEQPAAGRVFRTVGDLARHLESLGMLA